MRIAVLRLLNAVRAAFRVGMLALPRMLASPAGVVNALTILVELDYLTLRAVGAQIQAGTALPARGLRRQLRGEVAFRERLGRLVNRVFRPRRFLST